MSGSTTRVVEYTAHGHLGLGLQAWGQMFRELWESRELTWRLWQRDFSAKYRQSLLGYLWAIVPPIITVATFTWLNRSRILPIEKTSLPYPVFVLLGTTVWQLFAGGLTGATASLAGAGTLITKINFPRETIVIAAFGQSLLDFVIRLFLVAAAFAIYKVSPAWTVWLIPLAVIPLMLFTLGLGYFLALANGVLRDVGQLITFIVTFWMFFTPVIYPPTTVGLKSLINVVNPVSPFVIAAQDLTTKGYLTQPGNYAIGCIVGLFMFLAGWRVFHLSEPRIAERV